MLGFKTNHDKALKDKSQAIRYPSTGAAVPPSWKEVERYALNAPFAYAVIAEDPSNSTKKYFLDEVSLTPREGQIYTYILDTLESELTVPRGEIDAKTYFRDQAKRIVVKYGIRASQLAWPKILYFAERDLVGFGILDGLMRDPNIEDISADGLKKPLFVYQRKYENMETNIAFNDDKDLDNLVARLSHMAGKHISTAFPIVQGTLPGRHRLSATYRREVSPYGGTFTIRKFREDPITITDLINMNVIDQNIAAYVWLLMESRATAMVVGASVDYESPILCRIGGDVKLIEAGRLIDPHFGKDEDGRRYTSGVEVFSFNPSTFETGWHAIQYVYRHRHAGKMLKFRMELGREVTVTRDHSLFVLRNGRISSVPASDIGLGDFVVAAKSVDSGPTQVRTVDLAELLAPNGDGLFLYGVPRAVFDLLKGVSSVERKDWKHNRRLPLRYFRLLAGNYSGVTIGYRGTPARIDSILRIDEDFARFLGYYVAEGNVILKRGLQYATCFTTGPKDSTMIEEIRSYVKRQFGSSVRITRHGENSLRVVLGNRIVSELLHGLVGTGARRKRLPDVMLSSPSQVRRAFLKAWSTGDAGVTGSAQLANGILYLFLMEESIGSFYHRPTKGAREIEGRSVIARDSYYLRFPRPEGISAGRWQSRRIFGEPGFPVSQLPPELARMSYRRRKILANAASGQRVTGRAMATFRARVSELSDYSGTSLKNEEGSTHDGFYRSNSRFFDKAEGRLLTGRALLDLKEKVDEVNRLNSSTLAFLKVVGLEEVEPTSDFVYDVSVPGDENFLAGTGGVFCHNTGSGKTTLMNALLTFTRMNSKIVTIEEVQEANLPHSNWTALLSRESYGVVEDSGREIGLFDLVKTAMRMRPDILVVGEVRGEETYVLFQAISSVVGETPVLIREGGEARLMPIGELVDRFYPGDSERTPLSVRGIEALTFDREGKVLFKPVNYVLRHKTDAIYDVRYNGGEVRATGSHSVFVFDENCELVEKKVSELQPGDLLTSFSGSQVPMEHPVVDAEGILRKLLPDKVVSEKVLPRCPFCQSASIWRHGRADQSQRYMCKECKRTFRGTREKLEFSDRLKQSNGTELVSFVNSLTVPKRMRVDEKFAKVLGIYMADGCVKHHRGSRIVFSLGTPEKGLFINDLVGFFSTFGSKPSIDDRGTYSIIEFNHTPLALVFEALCGRELSEKHMPSFIWTSPPTVVNAFLQGWTADARRTLKGKVESYNSARPDLANAISWLARLNGRTSIISERGSKYRSANISRPGVEQNSKAVPNLPLIRLKRALNSTAWWYGPDVRKQMISKARARKALQDILQKKRSPITWEAAKLVSKISSLLDGSLIATPVRTVRKAKFEGFVYDISVPDTEAFFGGESPVALHNTGHGGISTVHADDVSSAIQRLTSKPMDVPAAFIPFLDLVFTVRRIAIPTPDGGFRNVRRVLSVDEVVSVGNYVKMFKWDPVTDKHVATPLKNSIKLTKLSRDLGLTPAELEGEVRRRATVLKWVQQRGIRNFKEVSAIYEEYRTDPRALSDRAYKELGLIRVAPESEA